MPQFYTAPVVSVLARPTFVEPSHLPVQWMGESTDGERLAEFAGRRLTPESRVQLVVRPP